MSGDRGEIPVPEDHGRFDELAVGWALHALEPEDEAVFALHLPSCPRCAITVAETSEVMAAMATDLPDAEPSDDLRRRLRAAVEETDQVVRREPAADPGPPPIPSSRPGGAAPDRRARTGYADAVPDRSPGGPAWRRALPAALIAAAVAAVIGLGIWNVSLSDSLARTQAAAAEQSEVLAALMTPGKATVAPLSDQDGHSVATVVARDGQVQVVTHGLSRNDATDSTYVVWGIGRDAGPVALGTFDVVRSQMDLRTVGSEQTGLDDFSGYGISLEPGRRAPAKPTDVVANG